MIRTSLIKFLLCFLFHLSLFAQSDNEDKIKVIEMNLNKATEAFGELHFDKSVEFSKKALIISFEIDDPLYIAQAYNSIGVVYDECSQTEKAIEFYEKALHYAKKVNNNKLNNWIYGNLGSVYYFNQIDVEKGIDFYKKALYYAEKEKDSIQIEFTRMNIASAYFSLNKFKVGEDYIKDIKDKILKSGNDENKLSLYTLQGIYESTYNNPVEAEKNYFKAIEIAQSNNYESMLINVYENMIRHYKKYKNKKLEDLYRSKYNELKQKVYSEEKLENIDKTAVEIQLDEQRVQLEKIESESVLNRQKVRESKLVVIMFVIIVIILLLFLLVLYKNIKTREKLNDELRDTNEKLKIAKEKAEEASQLKTQFVSTITHELRTPLYGVVGITNIIVDEHKELGSSPHLKSLKFSAKYLLSLVNDILQISKIEERKIVLENLIFNLPDEVSTIINSLEYIAEKNNNKLIVEIDTEIPEFLIGDKLRLSQIIMNLVSNALKFTKDGKVVVSCDLDRVEGTRHFIQFKVKDNGVGIAKENQEKIFEKFVQIERKEEDYQGTGLGLSIVSSLVELFGSKIYLESEENIGTTFSFTIPFEHDEKKSQEIINNIDVDLSEDNVYRILVVEDNKINQMVTKKIIQTNNMECTIVDDGYAALVALDREVFDIILMDINMPLINGFDTTKRIRERGIEIPVIALTAFDKHEVTDEAFNSGMNDVIVKPFEPSKLFQVIMNQIHKKKSDS